VEGVESWTSRRYGASSIHTFASHHSAACFRDVHQSIQAKVPFKAIRSELTPPTCFQLHGFPQKTRFFKSLRVVVRKLHPLEPVYV